MSTFQRRLVPLKPGEPPSKSLVDPEIPGMREETDEEFRTRIKSEMNTKTYLGDSVYVRVDEFGRFVLFLDNGLGPFSEIYLEPEVVEAFMAFIQRRAG